MRKVRGVSIEDRFDLVYCTQYSGNHVEVVFSDGQEGRAFGLHVDIMDGTVRGKEILLRDALRRQMEDPDGRTISDEMYEVICLK
jgi:hypothetical protein